jgi:hypothetical protein
MGQRNTKGGGGWGPFEPILPYTNSNGNQRWWRWSLPGSPTATSSSFRHGAALGPGDVEGSSGQRLMTKKRRARVGRCSPAPSSREHHIRLRSQQLPNCPPSASSDRGRENLGKLRRGPGELWTGCKNSFGIFGGPTLMDSHQATRPPRQEKGALEFLIAPNQTHPNTLTPQRRRSEEPETPQTPPLFRWQKKTERRGQFPRSLGE